MSHMICLYKIANGQLAQIKMEKIQQALSDLTSEDWSNYQGGEAFVPFPSLGKIQKPEPQSNIFTRLFRKDNELAEPNEQEIDADEHSIAFNRPQEGFETAMFELMSKLKLIVVRDESFTGSAEAIVSIEELSRADIPDEIDTMPTQGMELILIQTPNDLLEALYI